MPSEITFFLQIILSIALGGMLGYQRERWGKSAGPRTYALVTAGATLFTIMSLHAFGSLSPDRVASQIVVGVGFIGAGLILHRRDHVEGLTTAAGLWMTSAIGMAVGAGYYLLGIVTTILILLVLAVDDSKKNKAGK